MANCDVSITSLDPSCEALKKTGGIKQKFWIGKLNEVVTTLDVDGYVDSVSLVSASPVNTLSYVIGKQFKHNAQETGVFGENVNTINQIVNAILYYYTAEERTAVEGYINLEDIVLFVQTAGANSQVLMYGYDNGLKCTAFDATIGALLNDNTAATCTFSGEQYGLPKVLKIGSSVQDVVSALDALV